MDESGAQHTTLVLKKSDTNNPEDILYPWKSDCLPEGYEEYCQKTLNETEENRKRGIQILQEYVKQENLSCPNDDHLVLVLRCCKYNTEKAKTKLKKYLKLRQQVVSELAKIDMKAVKLLIDDLCHVFLPYRDRHGRVILYVRPHLHLDKYSLNDCIWVYITIALFILSDPMSQVYGACFITESRCNSYETFFAVARTARRQAQQTLDLPMRIGRINFMNTPFFARWLYALLRPILPEKIKKRIFFVGSKEELYEAYPPSILPENAGGTWTLSNNHYREDLINFFEKLRAENQH